MPNTGTISGLTAATEYVIDAVHVDASGNVSAVVSSSPFTTDAAPSILDDFNRANEALEASANWTTGLVTGGGTADIVSNQLVVTSTSGDGVYSATHGITVGPNQFAEATIESLSAGDMELGVAVRASGTGSSYTAYQTYHRLGVLRLQCVVNDSQQWIEVVAYTPTNGDVLRIEANGTTIRALVNGVEQLTRTASNIADGQPGIWSYSPNNTANGVMDDFNAGDL